MGRVNLTLAGRRDKEQVIRMTDVRAVRITDTAWRAEVRQITTVSGRVKKDEWLEFGCADTEPAALERARWMRGTGFVQ